MSLFGSKVLSPSVLSTKSRLGPNNRNNNDSNSTTNSNIDNNNAPLMPLSIDIVRNSILNRPTPSNSYNDSYYNNGSSRNQRHLYVLPVLLLEFLALALTRAVIPTLLLQTFGDSVYFVMGCAECLRGLLAFFACPMFGKISDVVGRKACLFITVLGTCSPVCSLAVLSWKDSSYTFMGNEVYGLTYSNEDSNTAAATMEMDDHHSLDMHDTTIMPDDIMQNDGNRMWIFVILLALSGVFSSTFTLTFAYISDTVKKKKDRVTAYGLALATFGLSFTIGPMAGGYLARVEHGEAPTIAESAMTTSEMEEETMESASLLHNHIVHPLGQKRVFTTSFLLVVLDLVYIYFILPESNSKALQENQYHNHHPMNPAIVNDEEDEYEDDESVSTWTSFTDRINHVRKDILPNSWSPIQAMKTFQNDPFMRQVGYIALLYYTSLWAVISTLVIYAAKRFHLGPERLGELMSALGLSTMISEAVLVRIVVPTLGEKKSIRLGLLAFALQCIVLGFAYEGWQLFVCVILSIGGNLVYPSLTSLVSGAVDAEMVGEALGAINGIKALTEGLGPLVFGTLMTVSEKTSLPGSPYLIASIFSILAYKQSGFLPDDDDDSYISEKYKYRFDQNGEKTYSRKKENQSEIDNIMKGDVDSDEEYIGLLSEIEEIDEGEVVQSYLNSSDTE
mmetsp:Transcript_13083/g.18724  ORF Transcript_13083/g.18724 Transcript_13083/m.18724 type:complete len:676 (+) Transcript_13083:228-2255(+)|eukprot:CAMPEP_0184860872 /NCGR_PEP_ID=MMETSP0580-20130426/5671_1 /TAXON_ID=1118495 /ORGANISM="Dactyliosolen fragilissimus" /LENGTH=675 /DNA_ID=CAMNT_0027358133 /DNA_START=92 /DNA_END=2119 /DNA_ORIENTATION=-